MIWRLALYTLAWLALVLVASMTGEQFGGW